MDTYFIQWIIIHYLLNFDAQIVPYLLSGRDTSNPNLIFPYSLFVSSFFHNENPDSQCPHIKQIY